MWLNLLLRLIQSYHQIEPVLQFYNYSIWSPNAVSGFLQTESKAENKPKLCRHFKFSFRRYVLKNGWSYMMDCHGYLVNPILDQGSWFFSFDLQYYLDIYALDIWCYILYLHWFMRCWPYNLFPEQPFRKHEFWGNIKSPTETQSWSKIVRIT